MIENEIEDINWAECAGPDCDALVHRGIGMDPRIEVREETPTKTEERLFCSTECAAAHLQDGGGDVL